MVAAAQRARWAKLRGNWPPTDGQKQVATLGGIRLWDDNVKWGQIETAKGVYDWSGLDSIISKAQAQHVDVLYTIGDTPKWAGTIPPKSPCGPTGSYSCSAPTDVKSDGTGADSYFTYGFGILRRKLALASGREPQKTPDRSGCGRRIAFGLFARASERSPDPSHRDGSSQAPVLSAPAIAPSLKQFLALHRSSPRSFSPCSTKL